MTSVVLTLGMCGRDMRTCKAGGDGSLPAPFPTLTVHLLRGLRSCWAFRDSAGRVGYL